MERRDGEFLRSGAEDTGQTLAQGGRRGGGESNSHNGRRRDSAVVHQIRDTYSEYGRLSAARPRQHAERTIARLNDLPLARGKVAEVHSCAAEEATPRAHVHRSSALAIGASTRCQ